MNTKIGPTQIRSLTANDADYLHEHHFSIFSLEVDWNNHGKKAL
jgi:hypothetical protein